MGYSDKYVPPTPELVKAMEECCERQAEINNRKRGCIELIKKAKKFRTSMLLWNIGELTEFCDSLPETETENKTEE